MLASQMICMACGYQGSFDTQEVSPEKSRPTGFQYLGHNPFTGMMHYQCPECNSYLNADPMDILKVDPVIGQTSSDPLRNDPYIISADIDFLLKLPGMIKDGVFGLTRYIGKNLGRSGVQ